MKLSILNMWEMNFDKIIFFLVQTINILFVKKKTFFHFHFFKRAKKKLAANVVSSTTKKAM